MRSHANFDIVGETEDTVFIRDLDQGNISVTNDAEWVVQTMLATYPGKRIVYRDSEGSWDELVHDGNVFLDFGPWKGTLPENL